MVVNGNAYLDSQLFMIIKKQKYSDLQKEPYAIINMH